MDDRSHSSERGDRRRLMPSLGHWPIGWWRPQRFRRASPSPPPTRHQRAKRAIGCNRPCGSARSSSSHVRCCRCSGPNVNLDDTWLRDRCGRPSRLAPLEARQLISTVSWAASVAVRMHRQIPGICRDRWWLHMGRCRDGAYGGSCRLDGWSDSVPSRRHATTAAFGFSAPKSFLAPC